jgi:CspA family cold shock protein
MGWVGILSSASGDHRHFSRCESAAAPEAERSVVEENNMTGTIKKVVKDKGFGFITPDDGSDEVFFHRSRLSPKVYFEDLRDGERVQFDVRPGEKGPQAFNLRLG